MPFFKLSMNYLLCLERIHRLGMQKYANQLWSANDVISQRLPTICSGSAANPVLEKKRRNLSASLLYVELQSYIRRERERV